MARNATFSPKFDKTRKRWVLSVPPAFSPTGKRQRRIFKTEDAATDEAARLKSGLESIGKIAAAASPELIKTAVEFEEVALEFGFHSLRHFLTVKIAELEEAGASPSLGELLDAFEQDRRRRWSKIFVRNRWRPFRKRLEGLADRRISGLDGDFWRGWFAEWLEEAEPAPSTFNQHLATLRQVFGHPLAARAHPRNPLAECERLKSTKNGIRTFSPGEARDLLEAAWKFDRELVPYFATCLFAGLRPDSEALAARFADFDWAEGVLEVRGTKTENARRFVEIEPALRAWLAPWSRLRRSILPPNFRRRRSWLIRGKYAKGAEPNDPGTWRAVVEWSPDVTRHSFGSYFEAAHRGEPGVRDRLVENMGHSSFKTFRQFYRNAKRPAAAAEFWGIRPPQEEAENVVGIA